MLEGAALPALAALPEGVRVDLDRMPKGHKLVFLEAGGIRFKASGEETPAVPFSPALLPPIPEPVGTNAWDERIRWIEIVADYRMTFGDFAERLRVVEPQQSALMLIVGAPTDPEGRGVLRDSDTRGLSLAFERTLLRKGEAVGKGGDPWVRDLRTNSPIAALLMDDQVGVGILLERDLEERRAVYGRGDADPVELSLTGREYEACSLLVDALTTDRGRPDAVLLAPLPSASLQSVVRWMSACDTVFKHREAESIRQWRAEHPRQRPPVWTGPRRIPVPKVWLTIDRSTLAAWR